MDLVKKRGSLKFHSEVTDIIQKVTLLIKEIPEYDNLKLNIDLCLYALTLATNLVKSKKVDVDELVITIMTKIYNLNEAEVTSLKAQIAYLRSSKAVKKVSTCEIVFDYLKKGLKFVKVALKNVLSNKIQSQIIPFNLYTNITQAATYIILSKMGINVSTIALILLFL